ncbi:MAG: hypothetical protein KAY32_05375 [Candidatus Eisenbacteria sp.]|nr:hypothetical protein [Candidatus Eisenbacteria bacterium]
MRTDTNGSGWPLDGIRRPVGLLLCVAALLLYGLGRPCAAQVRAAGMAGAYTALASGTDAPAWNPANLALYRERGVVLLAAHAGIGNNSYSLDDYRQLNGAYWGEAEKQTILERIEGNSFDLAGSGSVSALSSAWGDWAVSSRTRAASTVSVPKEYLRLILYGNTVGESFDLAGADGHGVVFSEFALCGGRPLEALLPRLGSWAGEWTVGVSLKLLRGWSYAQVLEAEGGLTTTETSLDGSGFVRTALAQGGWGFACDLGVAGRLADGWYAGLSIRDLFGAIRWDEEAEERTESFDASDVTLEEIDGETVETESESIARAAWRSDLPVTWAFGIARRLDRWSLAADLAWASGDGFGAPDAPRAALGVEYRVRDWLLLRGGGSLGGLEGAGLAGGLGLGWRTIRLDLALHSWGTFNPFSSNGLGLGLGLGLAL